MSRYVLLSSDDGGLTVRVELERDTAYRIGSSTRCDVHLARSDVSRSHAMLRVDRSGRLSLSDLGSKNGTFVDGRRVEEVELTTGRGFSISTVPLMVVEMSSGAYRRLEPQRPPGEREEADDTADHRPSATFEDGVRLLEATARAVETGRCDEVVQWLAQRFQLRGVALLARCHGDLSVLHATGSLVERLEDERFAAALGDGVDAAPDEAGAREVRVGGHPHLVLTIDGDHLLVVASEDGPRLETAELGAVRAACRAVVAAAPRRRPDHGGDELSDLTDGTLDEALDAVERVIVASALAATGGHRTRCAERLGISRSRLSKKIRRFGLGTE